MAWYLKLSEKELEENKKIMHRKTINAMLIRLIPSALAGMFVSLMFCAGGCSVLREREEFFTVASNISTTFAGFVGALIGTFVVYIIFLCLSDDMFPCQYSPVKQSDYDEFVKKLFVSGLITLGGTLLLCIFAIPFVGMNLEKCDIAYIIRGLLTSLLSSIGFVQLFFRPRSEHGNCKKCKLAFSRSPKYKGSYTAYFSKLTYVDGEQKTVKMYDKYGNGIGTATIKGEGTYVDEISKEQRSKYDFICCNCGDVEQVNK
ncbi:MAG: hypothetical protein IJA82_06365 [Clostridia bacterium]|nr:hypothetical protein [Clostridia bacterium]